MKVIVTGGEGQLAHFIGICADRASRHEFVLAARTKLDLSSAESINAYLKSQRPDVVINAGALSNVDQAESSPIAAEQVNAEAVKILSELSHTLDFALIQVSTDYVFDGRAKQPYQELDSPAPLNVYGRTKLLGEDFARQSKKGAILRTSLLYSLWGSSFVSRFFELAKTQDQVFVVEDQYASPTYAWDLAKFIVDHLEDLTEFLSVEMFHFSNQGSVSRFELARAVVEITGPSIKLVTTRLEDQTHLAPRPGFTSFNLTKVESQFADSTRPWKDALHRALEHQTP